MHELNTAMIQLNVRKITSDAHDATGFDEILLEHRISQRDIVWLSTLSKRQLNALNKLPIGLYRVYYRTMNVGTSGLEDEQLLAAGSKMTMFMESVNFVFRNHIHPLVGIGFDQAGFDEFSNAPFGRRIMLITKGGFGLSIRCDLSSLKTDPNDPENLIQDCTRIILGDLRYFLGQQKSRALGQLKDWDRNLVKLEEIARNILVGGIQPKLVATFTGLTEQRIDNIKRTLQRDGVVLPSQAGRIQVPMTIVKTQPMHSLLFIAIYQLLANQPTSKLSARAVVEAGNQYRLIADHVGIERDNMLTPSNCYVLANALKAREISLEPCRSCRELILQSTDRRSRCIWCGE